MLNITYWLSKHCFWLYWTCVTVIITAALNILLGIPGFQNYGISHGSTFVFSGCFSNPVRSSKCQGECRGRKTLRQRYSTLLNESNSSIHTSVFLSSKTKQASRSMNNIAVKGYLSGRHYASVFQTSKIIPCNPVSLCIFEKRSVIEICNFAIHTSNLARIPKDLCDTCFL